MPTRQYVGARYVPEFFYGTGGSAEWVSNTQYEALTIVTRNGNSYTSRKPVPTSVGAPENNPEYWASTGIFNSQVEQYREEVAELATEMSGYESQFNTALFGNKPVGMKKAIIISDSYGVTESGRLFETLINKLSLGTGDYYTGASGSVGFAHANNDETFLTIFNSIVGNLDEDELAEITHVIVVGGANDTLETDSAVTTAITNFYNAARSACPNCKVYIGFCGVKFDWTQAFKYGSTCAVYRRVSKILYKCVYLSGVEYVLHNISYMQSDGLHPNTSGCDALAGGIYQALVGGNCDVAYPVLAVGTIGNTQERTLQMRLDNNVTELFINNFCIIDYNENQTVYANGSDAFNLATLSTNGYCCGDGYQANGENITVFAKQGSAATFTAIPGFIEYSNGIVKWHPIAFSSGTATAGNISFNKLYIPRFNIRMNTCWN